MEPGDARPRAVVVLGPPGSAGEVVVQALCAAGFVDVSLAARADHDEWLAVCRASRLAPPPLDPDPARSAQLGPPLSDEADTVSFDPATALALRDPERVGGAPDLAVIVWTRPEWTVRELARAGVGIALATALWDRYQRAALVAPTGLPAVVVDGEELRGGGARAARQLDALWTTLGVDAASIKDLVSPDASPPPLVPSGVDAPCTLSAPVPGAYPEWRPGPLDPEPAWIDELLDAEWRAHRSVLEAGEAWQALTAERNMPPGDARARDPEHDVELWRLRDRAIGMEAELVTARHERDAADARAHDAIQQIDALQNRWEGVDRDDLESARADRDHMLASLQWRVGHHVLEPVRRVRRALRRP